MRGLDVFATALPGARTLLAPALCGQAERRAGKAVLQEQLAERQEARLLAAEALDRERAAVLAQAGPGRACPAC